MTSDRSDFSGFFAGKVLKVWLLIGLFFIICEVGMRYRAVQRFGQIRSTMIADDPVEGRRLIPGFVSKGVLRTITINEHGFRSNTDSTSFSLQPPPGTLRIACLGSSTVFSGMSNSNGDTFPAVLEKTLNDDLKGHPPVEVVNAGIPGMGTEAVQKHLELRVSKAQPHIAVIYPPPNDLGTEIEGPGRQAADNTHFLKRWRKEHSVLYNAVLDKVRQMSLSPSAAAAQFRHFPQDGKEHLVAKYRQLIAVCRSLHIEPVLVLHTFLLRKDQSPAVQRKNIRGDFWGLGVSGALEAVDAQIEATREAAAAENVLLIDTEFCVPATDEYFEDTLHLSPKGNAVLAETAADGLKKGKIIPEAVR
ncbi:MAG: SGNH/GDSL hydrolase family protein [Planctomycetaceae bacterium]|jgi:lysophospholipase L1-like esterase|nr:SGNH/GDSL hydrolase family protein [Planctomycetaceae bacterium]